MDALYTRLLTSVFNDISAPLLVAGCRSLGVISKILTASLWRDVENKSQIFDMNDKLAAIIDFLNETKDNSSDVIRGKLLPFPEIFMDESDRVMQNLFKLDEYYYI